MKHLTFLLTLLIGSIAGAIPIEEAIEKQPFTTLAPGEYTITRTIEIAKDTTIIIQNGATLKADCTPVFCVKGGDFRLEGQGKPATIICTKKGARGYRTTERAAVFDLNQATGELPLRFFIRNVNIEGFNGIDAYHMTEGRKDIDEIQAIECNFKCVEKAIGANTITLRTARIENCVFEGGDSPIYLNVPMPGGCLVRGNTLRGFGRSGIMLGKGGQIAEGCTTHLPDTIVHDNRLIEGGHGSTLADSYIHGILIYGNNVSVQGNIVRDVNRGVPVPGERIGQHIVAPDGTILRGKKINWKGKDRRLAGAAIYLKCNRALVQGNICTNSGWRSVIEIKTGGKEYYTSVVNNVVDGSALAIDESFGFECNAGRSLWAGNVVYNMPNQAFVVRSGFENTFINNLISDTKVGFGLSGSAPGEHELIAGNRFINVEYPVALDQPKPVPSTGTDVLLPSTARIRDDEELPPPDQQWHGRQLVRGDKIYVGVASEGGYRWMELQGNLLPVPKYELAGPELMFNSDQSGKEQSTDPELSNPKYPGWRFTCRSVREAQIPEEERGIAPDTTVFQTGGRSLKVVFPTQAAEWRLAQQRTLVPGRRYRATAVVQGEEPRNLRLEVRPDGSRSTIERGKDVQGWQTLTCDFIMPKNKSKCFIFVWGSKTTMGKAAWIDSVSLRELVEEGGTPAPPPDMQKALPATPMPELEGDNLLPPDIKWSPSSSGSKVVLEEKNTIRVTPGKDGAFMLVAKVKLEPGIPYVLHADELSSGSCSVVLSDGNKILGKRTFCAFTTPDTQEKPTQLRIWIPNCKAGEDFMIHGVALHRQLKK